MPDIGDFLLGFSLNKIITLLPIFPIIPRLVLNWQVNFFDFKIFFKKSGYLNTSHATVGFPLLSKAASV